ncbi:MAG: hypothetical protein WCE81_13475 [Halobacteriota archaeon]
MPIPTPLKAIALQSQIEWHTSQPILYAIAYHSASPSGSKAYRPSDPGIAG